MTPLRQRMIEDMQLRNLTPETQRLPVTFQRPLDRFFHGIKLWLLPLVPLSLRRDRAGDSPGAPFAGALRASSPVF